MKRFILGLMLLVLPIVSQAYEPVEDITWSSCSEGLYIAKYNHYNNELFPVNYRYCTVGGGLSPLDIENDIQTITGILFDFMQSSSPKGKQCVANGRLEIYSVKPETLNQRGRFPLTRNAGLGGELSGLYDPRVEVYNTSSLTLTNGGGKSENRVTLAHELAHYWYDRLCWGKFFPNPEGFAKDFEKIYKRESE